MKHILREEIILDTNKKTIRVLSENGHKVIGLGFKEGQILEKHQTSTPAFLIVQSGKVDFKMQGKVYELNTGDYFEIPASIEHEVVGKEDSFLYLIK